MRHGLWLAVTLALAALIPVTPVWAESPATSLRPMPRPGFDAATGSVLSDPVETLASPEDQAAPDLPVSTPILAASLRPRPRPEGLSATVELAAAPMPEPVPEPAPTIGKKKKKAKASKNGSVCGDADIKGEALVPIKGKVTGCGLDKPVRVTAISGIRLNQSATISCDTAAAFKTWIEKGLRPAMGKREVVEIRIAASYVCRPRNNKKGAKISEHGRGGAVDVAGFVFSDGTQWSVLKNYGKELRRAHKAACGIFGTTLGPGSDGYHQDHLHFDTASYRSGPYCK